jgi:phage repressor protein C with HTH and peptisase S24 domain
MDWRHATKHPDEDPWYKQRFANLSRAVVPAKALPKAPAMDRAPQPAADRHGTQTLDRTQNNPISWPPHTSGAPYELVVKHDKMAPLLRQGSVIAFDPSIAPRIGDVVAVWFNKVPDSEPLIGAIGRMSEEKVVVKLDADGNAVSAFRRDIATIHVAPNPNLISK